MERFEANSSLDGEALKEAGLVKRMKDGIKLLGNGDISHPLFVKVNKISKTAKEKIETAGGTVEIIMK